MNRLAHARAQRWHDTDHGAARSGPLRNNQFRINRADDTALPTSSCWCCCPRCDPDENPARCNPFWNQAQAAYA